MGSDSLLAAGREERHRTTALPAPAGSGPRRTRGFVLSSRIEQAKRLSFKELLLDTPCPQCFLGASPVPKFPHTVSPSSNTPPSISSDSNRSNEKLDSRLEDSSPLLPTSTALSCSDSDDIHEISLPPISRASGDQQRGDRIPLRVVHRIGREKYAKRIHSAFRRSRDEDLGVARTVATWTVAFRYQQKTCGAKELDACPDKDVGDHGLSQEQ
jgi:hypothetical protein